MKAEDIWSKRLHLVFMNIVQNILHLVSVRHSLDSVNIHNYTNVMVEYNIKIKIKFI